MPLMHWLHSPTTDEYWPGWDRLNEGKAACRLWSNPTVLWACASQLSVTLNLKQEKLPGLWETSCLALVQMSPSTFTSLVMKLLEKLAEGLIETSLSPLQFIYPLNLGVDEAVIYLLKRAYSCLHSNSWLCESEIDRSTQTSCVCEVLTCLCDRVKQQYRA